MAAPSLTKNELPTVWLAPPPGFPPSNHKIEVEPAPVVISSVLALVIFIVVTFIFNMKKRENYLDDFLEEAEGADKDIEPGNIQNAEHAVAAPAQGWVNRPTSRGTPRYSNLGHRLGMEDYSNKDWDDTRDFEHDSPTRTPMTTSSIRHPAPVHHRKGSFDDDTTLANENMADFDDTSGSDVSFGQYGHADLRSNLHLPGYPTSYYPSEFKPLAPEDVGMYGKIWK